MEAFIKKKKNPSNQKNFTVLKVMFKILFRPFWVILVKKNLGEKYLVIFRQFLDLEIFYKCLTFQGGKKHFFSKSAPIMV